MPNHLSTETSPYLLQHADQPVDWYPWNDEALSRAREENKPIFLSIGYAACHWCHVMAHESFDDPRIAAYLNNYFISIKVDREERPDLDAIYMSAVVAMTGQGGWPMSLFLTPDGRPFYGGTYFPPEPRYGMPSFDQVIVSIQRSWMETRDQIEQIGSRVAAALRQSSEVAQPPVRLQSDALEQATRRLVDSFDWATGGWGKAPLFPQSMVLETLLRQATRKNEEALQVAVRALEAMMAGGLYDLVGGGFHRYSTDAEWLVPHFEKMLYDNAQLALVYLHGFQLTGKEEFRQVCEETLDFISREETDPQGGFYSSLDADSEDGEGRYYTWSIEEFTLAIPDPDLRRKAAIFFGMPTLRGHQELTILRRSRSLEDLAAETGTSPGELSTQLNQARQQLFSFRDQRARPATDDKVITAWNALAIQAFAEAGAVFQKPAYIQVATRNARFILSALRPDGRLLRAWRHIPGKNPAFLEDYAALILGLISLYQVDPQVEWYTYAVELQAEMNQRFSDPRGGFFDTSADQPTPLTRPKDIQDHATPSGNALASLVLLKLSEFSGEHILAERAETMLGALQASMIRYPSSFGFWLQALDEAVDPAVQAAVIGPHGAESTRQFHQAYFSAYRPRTVLAIAPDPPPPGSPVLLADRAMLNGLPTGYVCEKFFCRLPTTDVGQFKALLEAASEKR
jgi:uncharacterized protein YyaL (SSP411 family)